MAKVRTMILLFVVVALIPNLDSQVQDPKHFLVIMLLFTVVSLFKCYWEVWTIYTAFHVGSIVWASHSVDTTLLTSFDQWRFLISF